MKCIPVPKDVIYGRSVIHTSRGLRVVGVHLLGKGGIKVSLLSSVRIGATLPG